MLLKDHVVTINNLTLNHSF